MAINESKYMVRKGTRYTLRTVATLQAVKGPNELFTLDQR